MKISRLTFFLKPSFFLCVVFYSFSTYSDVVFDADFGLEHRYFFENTSLSQSKNNPALNATLAFENLIDENWFFKGSLDLRYDDHDSQRSSINADELFLQYARDNLEINLGSQKVFWGRAEISNVVDVINQRDFVSGDTKAKLGQPMLNINYQLGLHQLEFYSLLGTPQQTYSSKEGRLSTLLPVDMSQARYINTHRHDSDFAFRFSGPFTDHLEVGFSYFSGTERMPYFDFNYDINDPKLIPTYVELEQLGIELEYIKNNVALKLEAAHKEDFFNRYWTSVLSSEYNLPGLLGSVIDLTLVAEYFWDERQEGSVNFFENDIALAARIAFNDAQSTEVTLSGIFDHKSKEQIYRIEARRRLTDQLQASLIGQLFVNTSKPEQLESVFDLSQQFLNNPLIVSEVSIEQIVSTGLQILENNDLTTLSCLLDVVGCFESIDNDPMSISALQVLQRNSFSRSKLNFLEQEDYVQLNLTYSF